MKTYTLKPEFKGLSIAKNIFPIGIVTLDTNIVSPEDYEKYIKLGFQDIFDEVQEIPTYTLDENEIDNMKCNNESNDILEHNLETGKVIIKKYINVENAKPRKPRTKK